MVGGLLAVLAACSGPPIEQPPAPLAADLRFFGKRGTIEIAPVHYAIAQLGAAQGDVANGGIPDMFIGRDGRIGDLAGQAETQALRSSLDHQGIRIILTIAEGHYRIIARRSAGIETVADLRGKRVATMPGTSAAFYLDRVLGMAGMNDEDVRIVAFKRPQDIAQTLLDGRADALAIWEPEAEIAAQGLGDDAVIFAPDVGYRELYNLQTTEAKLADPVSREKVVRFVMKLIEASRNLANDPSPAIALAEEASGYPAQLIRAAWPHHDFSMTLSPDLLDTLEAEEGWLARHAGRSPRTREELAIMIDPSVEAEARARLSAQN
ncbi:MAG: ABC transporter substrate-binding protein [Sphingobium sp.]